MLKLLSSLKITVASLIWLFLLTLWGTIAQVNIGLYAAQEQFFFNWIFWVFNAIPLPAGRLVIWILFINLIAVTITRFSKYKNMRYAGILIIHFGMILYLVSAGVIFHLTQESNVHLLEKTGTNLSASYFEWEIAFWKSGTNPREVIAIDPKAALKGLRLDSLGVDIFVTTFYENAVPAPFVSGTGFQEIPYDIERERNVAAMNLAIKDINSGVEQVYQLWGGDEAPKFVKIFGDDYALVLRRKMSVLPFTIVLDDFRAEFHPGTEMARSYESDVTIKFDDNERKANISMNEPFLYKDYAIYQAAYMIDQEGREYSTLAVVKNAGRILPYISSFVVFFGLLWHFIAMALRKKS